MERIYLKYIVFVCSLLSSFISLGQNRINMTNVPIRHTMIEDFYVVPDKEKSIRIQEDNVPETLDGYIRWFVSTDINNPDNGTVEKSQISVLTRGTNGTEYSSDFWNGYVWNNTERDKDKIGVNANTGVNTIKVKFSAADIAAGKVLVCDLSSVQAQSNNQELTPRIVSLRRIYRIKNASVRSAELTAARTNFQNLLKPNNNAPSNISALLGKTDQSDYVLASYHIHTPLQNSTNFRIPDKLDNYFVGDKVATHVRWTFYDENGQILNSDTKPTNFVSKWFEVSDQTILHQRYILAEVLINGSFYPVSLTHIYLEPYSMPMTQSELERSDFNFAHRKVDDLVASGAYSRIVDISFDHDEVVTNLTINNNIRGECSTWESQYAFAEPNMYNYRKANRVSVGRREYALYRSLNYEGVSDRNISVTSQGGSGKYVDYFIPYYNKIVVDRLAERTNKKQYGYFLYLDAADEPGVITRIPIEEDLCTNTSLLVTAWVCNLASTENADIAQSDVGFTFKKRDTITGVETILAKFYSGKMPRKHEDGNQGKAFWQQIAFEFIIPEVKNQNEIYLVELANNCESSNGADYGIDDIQVFKSLPDISVQRQDACHSSDLLVSLDYLTLLRNMGWNIDHNVLDEVDLTNPEIRKYRYGLMGENPYSPSLNSNFGNVYSAFVDYNNNWVSINKYYEDDPELVALGMHKSYRAVIQTDMHLTSADGLLTPTSEEAARRAEIIMNVRAMNDYNADLFQRGGTQSSMPPYYNSTNPAPHTYIDLTNFVVSGKGQSYSPESGKVIYTTGWEVNIEAILQNPTEFELLVREFYKSLKIPPLHCSWTDEERLVVYLDKIKVENTDLRYAGEVYYEGDQLKTADGKYKVVIFTPEDILQGAGSIINFNDPCALISPFTVRPSITITVDSEQSHSQTNCYGNIRTFSAQLWVENPNGEMVRFEESSYNAVTYTFDWFLGNREEYDGYTTTSKTLHDLLVECRNSLSKYTGVLTPELINESTLTSTEKSLLIGLLGDNVTEPKLISGKNVSLRWIGHMIAMPYVPDYQGSDEYIYSFCTETQDLELDGKWNTPEMELGFPDAVYQINEVPLRLGLRHVLGSGITFEIPIQDEITLGAINGKHFGLLPNSNKVLLRQSNNVFYPVATLNSLYAVADGKENKLSVTFNNADNSTIAGLFKEGEAYSLYVPFGEYDQNGDFLPDACEGYAVLQIKIVPEFLTWQGTQSGNDTEVWYKDTNWKQSTEAELYKGNKGYVDANGSDDVAKAFTPLYFSKITIPVNQTLELENLSYQNNVLQGLNTSKATENIQYEMAIDTVSGAYKVSPYYMNKVNEIYFKPGAQLRRQHYLTYDTARIEFEMAKEVKYWMASPLQDVFAGDMYAPKSTARQETFAFEPIYYATDKNDRQEPAFYQKAWDKGILNYTNTEGTASTAYSVVHSNWSIEYNDVNVPYALGKGFYASVEAFTNNDNTALIRLPKADQSYLYEPLKSTKALSTIATRGDNVGKLAKDEDIVIILSDSDDKEIWETTEGVIADGDGTHFLLGNPYMYPLDMTNFLKANEAVLAQKYWTLVDGTVSVGTPDVEFEWTDGTPLGQIAPMQAFFVELKEGGAASETTKVTFRPNMMVGETFATTSELRSSVSATNPVLSLIAEKGDLRSLAFVSVREDASNSYESDKDAVVMIDSELTDIPQVYTVAGDRAAGVNIVKNIQNIPLGIYAGNKEEVTLTIEGISQFIGTLYLYDAVTKKLQTLVGDSHTLTLSGSSHGRYFLRSSDSPTGNETIHADAISIYSPVRGQVFVSANESLKLVQVFTTNGTMVRSLTPYHPVSQFTLSQGVYIIRAVAGESIKSEKIYVR